MRSLNNMWNVGQILQQIARISKQEKTYSANTTRLLGVLRTIHARGTTLHHNYNDGYFTRRGKDSGHWLSVLSPNTPRFTYSLHQIRNYSKFTAGRDSLALSLHPLTDERAHDLVCSLSDKELTAIRSAIEKLDAGKFNESAEG